MLNIVFHYQLSRSHLPDADMSVSVDSLGSFLMLAFGNKITTGSMLISYGLCVDCRSMSALFGDCMHPTECIFYINRSWACITLEALRSSLYTVQGSETLVTFYRVSPVCLSDFKAFKGSNILLSPFSVELICIDAVNLHAMWNTLKSSPDRPVVLTNENQVSVTTFKTNSQSHVRRRCFLFKAQSVSKGYPKSKNRDFLFCIW